MGNEAEKVTDLIPSVSIDNFLAQRDAMIERAREAQRLLREVDTIAAAMPGAGTWPFKCRLEMRNQGCRSRDFTDDDGIEFFVKALDSQCWSQLFDESGMRSFMDATAREQWHKALSDLDVPELTRANVESTFRALHEQRGDMFERGVVAVFKGLSWDYKTNLPVGFGKRIIVRYLTDTYGLSSHGVDKIGDLIRVMSVLDNKPEPDHRTGAVRGLRHGDWKDGDVADLGYLTVKRHKNGNGHITFARPDLVEKLNQIVAKHYPGALPPARE